MLVAAIASGLSLASAGEAQVFTKPPEKRSTPIFGSASPPPIAKPRTPAAPHTEANSSGARAGGGMVSNQQVNQALGRLRFKPGRWRTYVNGHALAGDRILVPDKWRQFRFSLLMLDGFDWDSNCPSSTCGAWPSENAKVSKFLIDNGKINFHLESESWTLSAHGTYNYEGYSLVVTRSPANVTTTYVSTWIGP